MNPRMSRRELLAWMAAGAGATATGASWLHDARADRAQGDVPTAVGNRSETANDATVDASNSNQRRASATRSDQPMLVVLEMPGGNDGLSLAVPYATSAYYAHRDQTAIAADDVLSVDDQIGLHPNLTRLHQRGISLVEGVGSTVPDGSHFEMQARWWAGSSTAGLDRTGWIGRLADLLSDGETRTTAVSIGTAAHPIMRAATNSTLSLPSADAIWAVAGAGPDDPYRLKYQQALSAYTHGDTAHATTMQSTLDFAEAIAAINNETDDDTTNSDDGDSDGDGYESWGVGSALRFAAQVLAADTGVSVVHVSMEGDFDTHDGHAWRHPELMERLDVNLTAFHDHLDQLGLGDQVLVMTTSEFGRTLRENGSGGLDHGTASTLMLSGPATGATLGWRHGESPSLTDLDSNDDLKATVPLESYLGGVVEGWMGIPSDEIFATSDPLTFPFS